MPILSKHGYQSGLCKQEQICTALCSNHEKRMKQISCFVTQNLSPKKFKCILVQVCLVTFVWKILTWNLCRDMKHLYSTAVFLRLPLYSKPCSITGHLRRPIWRMICGIHHLAALPLLRWQVMVTCCCLLTVTAAWVAGLTEKAQTSITDVGVLNIILYCISILHFYIWRIG